MFNILRSLGPAVPRVSVLDASRAGLGAVVGLGVTGLLILSPKVDLELGLYMIAPFGATSVLLFAVPNSPLAQPWPAIVGNVIAAIVGVVVCMVVVDPVFRVAFAVGLAISTMMLLRAVHPPAGAVAMTAALSPEAIEQLGFWFALSPVAAGSAALVVLATVYARVTGRHYPFRQFDDRSAHDTEDQDPVERIGLSEEELTGILERYRQTFNLGVEDLSRLIGAAELQAASHAAGPLEAEGIMSRDLVTVRPDATLSTVAALFRKHRFTSLPVVDEEHKFLGIIFQMHLINRASDDALRLNRRFGSALRRLVEPGWEGPVRAGDVMNVGVPRATTKTPFGALLPLLAEGQVDAIPVLEYGRVVGIVTRTDMVAALARVVIRSA